jgi:hypothetical protein
LKVAQTFLSVSWWQKGSGGAMEKEKAWRQVASDPVEKRKTRESSGVRDLALLVVGEFIRRCIRYMKNAQ